MSAGESAQRAAKAAITMQVLGIVGLTVDGAYWQASHGRVLPAYALAVGVFSILLTLLLARRHRPSETLSVAAALANVGMVVFALWGADDLLAREPRTWVPFQPHKLSVLALALVAPTPPWVGVASILAVTLAAVAQYLTFPPEVQAHLAVEEPWATLAFGAFALVTFAHRLRLLRIEREAAHAQAEADALKRLASIGLAVRDLSNTPLQTLRIAVGLLRRRHPEEAAQIDRMDRALDRLAALDGAFSRYEAETPFPPSASFDPLAVLEHGGRVPEARQDPCAG
jgi:hypothetical protein